MTPEDFVVAQGLTQPDIGRALADGVKKYRFNNTGEAHPQEGWLVESRKIFEPTLTDQLTWMILAKEAYDLPRKAMKACTRFQLPRPGAKP